MQKLYENVFYAKEVNELFTDEALIGYLLHFEAALAQAQANHEIIPAFSAAIIEECCKVENINMERLVSEAGLGGNVAIPLIKQLTAIVKQKNSEAAKYVHFGATSQDAIDSALMVQLKDAMLLIDMDLQQLIGQLISLAESHRNTIMIGRSFLQHARPITFGYKVAGWLDPLLRSKQKIKQLFSENFVLQLGGAVGSLSNMNEKGLAVIESMCSMLQLNNPAKPWHTQRDRLAEIATTFGIIIGNVGKIAKDVSLMMQTEIAEVFEPPVKGKGGSSTMPHKRNPVGCITILANAQRVPQLVASLLSCMVQDHERATGHWHAEWETLSDIVTLTAGAIRQAVNLTDGLEINAEQMLLNLDITKGLIFAESVSLALAEKMGKTDAHELIEQCCTEARLKKVHLKEILLSNSTVKEHIDAMQVNFLFEPRNSIGLCNEFIERVLQLTQIK